MSYRVPPFTDRLHGIVVVLRQACPEARVQEKREEGQVVEDEVKYQAEQVVVPCDRRHCDDEIGELRDVDDGLVEGEESSTRSNCAKSPVCFLFCEDLHNKQPFTFCVFMLIFWLVATPRGINQSDSFRMTAETERD